MAEEREGRDRRFDEICKTDNDPVDPCQPTVPNNLNPNRGEDPCVTPEEEVCDYNLRDPDVDPKPQAADPPASSL